MSPPGRPKGEFRSALHEGTEVNARDVVAAVSAARVAALFAVDPVGLGGIAVRSAAGPAREQWLGSLRSLLPAGTPWRRVPPHIDDDRLLGGLDLAGTLQAGRPVAQRGLLAEADGGVVLLTMAERLGAATAASLAAVIDTQQVVAERRGIGTRSASRIGVVALDEGIDDEQMPARLRERLAFQLELDSTPAVAGDDPPCTRDDVIAARSRFAAVRIEASIVESLCAVSVALGIDSVRAALLACRAARACAALDGRDGANAQDVAFAAALVLAPRATRLPAVAGADDGAAEPEPASGPTDQSTRLDDPDAGEPPVDTGEPDTPAGAIDDVVLEAALAAIPPGLLAMLALGSAKGTRSSSPGRAGATKLGPTRGRPTSARRGEPQSGARLNVIETLRAAAPWQALRRRDAEAEGRSGAARVQVRREDFRVWQFKQRSETTTIFVVDASGSAALSRLAETKGAVELLLADCYVRRDSVAVIAFRGAGAELLLPPTRSLVRAKRSLAGLPGGGGTPLAAGIECAHALADAVRRRGATPVLVLMTDGRANIARDGAPGRARAVEDAHAAARAMRAEGFATLLLDTSPQPQEPASQLAAAMGARYLPLPHAGASVLSQAVRAAGVAPAR
jgi:magnesium chelatase subunit D